jgi:uncharacterized membrane protein
MIIASGQDAIGVLVLAVVVAGIVLGIFFFARKPSTLAITFASVTLGLCGLLLWLIFRRG